MAPPAKPGDIKPQDSMTWQFYGGTLDPGKLTRENIVFFFCMDPKKFLTMMDGIDEFTPAQRPVALGLRRPDARRI